MNAKKEIESIISSISGKYSPYQVFSDWVQCCAIAIANRLSMIQDDVFEEREKEYTAIISKYTEEEQESFAKMFVLLADALGEDMTDVLGEIYMEMEMGSKYTGQFFTPIHVSQLCADLALCDEDEIRVNEPACGGGAMIIATAKRLKDKGINYQKRMKVIAQDLDWKGVYMCYLQLSLLGIDAIVVQGDTLSEPYTKNYPKRRILRTPGNLGLLI